MLQSENISTGYLDGLWIKVIRLMYSFTCAKCKIKDDTLQCHHVVMRSDKRHRWHPLNGVLLCATCHDWAHTHPRRFKTWLKRNLPEVYKNSRTKGFEGRDHAYIKENLLVMQAMLIKIMKKGGDTFLYGIFLILVVAFITGNIIAIISRGL